MEFRKLTLECIDKLRPFFEDNQCRICDCTIGVTFMWRDYHNTHYAVEDGILYLSVTHPEQGFAPPRSAGAVLDREPYERLIQHCGETGRPVRMCFVSETVMEGLLEMFPGSAVRTDRACTDYLYSSGDLIHLAGRKFAGQRNHINRFLREHPEWSFERITGDNLNAAKDFIRKKAREIIKDSPTYSEGNIKAIEALDNLEAYRQFGGALYVNGEVIGVSLGEIVGDTLFVHTEKADPGYHGSYPILMNQFARRFANEETKYINREEDDGEDGLRTSKLSYHPVDLLNKYTVELA